MEPIEIPAELIRQMDELEQLARAGVPHVPSRGSVAAFMRFQRGMLGWKKGTLASFAGVSLSTVERIERGEPVSAECLDKVASALGQPAAFTEPRVPLTAEEYREKIEDGLAGC